MPQPLVTLFTDASWCPETKAGGWAAWFKENGIPRRHGGTFKDTYHSIGPAEAAALVNGLYCVSRLYTNARVIAQTDSLDAIRLLTMTGLDSAQRRQWERLRAEYALVVELRHVKGHRGVVDPRAAINSWCDKEAKGHMKRRRHELRQQSRDCALANQSVMT